MLSRPFLLLRTACAATPRALAVPHKQQHGNVPYHTISRQIALPVKDFGLVSSVRTDVALALALRGFSTSAGPRKAKKGSKEGNKSTEKAAVKEEEVVAQDEAKEDELEKLEEKMEEEAKGRNFLDLDDEDGFGQDLRIHPKPTFDKASSIDDVEFVDKNSRSVSEDRTPGKYEQIKSMISGYKSAPRAILQKELQMNGITADNAKKYCDMLEERGLDTHEKVNLFLRRMRPRFPKLS